MLVPAPGAAQTPVGDVTLDGRKRPTRPTHARGLVDAERRPYHDPRWQGGDMYKCDTPVPKIRG